MELCKGKSSMNAKLLQHELLKMMKEFHQVCVDNGLTYYMLGGTCLGSIRHKGFIPWDDDMDIGMPRKAYNEFIQKAQKILPPHMEIRYYKNAQNSPFHFVKLINKNTTLIEKMYTNYAEGVYIDLFPLDYIDPDFYFEKKRFKLIKLFHTFVMKHVSTEKQTTLKGRLFTPIAKMIPLKALHFALEKLMVNNYDKNKSYVCNLLGAYGEREIVPQSFFGKPTLYKFEDTDFYGPENYDEYLKRIYGNYMQPPPEKERVLRHNYHYVNLNLPYRDYIKTQIKKE